MIHQHELQHFILKKFVERLSFGNLVELSSRGEEWTLEMMPALASQVREAIEAHPSLYVVREETDDHWGKLLLWVAFKKPPHIVYGGIDE